MKRIILLAFAIILIKWLFFENRNYITCKTTAVIMRLLILSFLKLPHS